jgi:hypothetical protein
MFKMKKALLLILFFIATSCLIAPVCYANAAEPPSIFIIAPNAPDDLEISIGLENIKARRTDKLTESYFAFYSADLKSANYTVKVSTGGKTFETVLDIPLKSHNNIFTLNIENETLTPGKSLTRTLSLLSFRIILTLLIEGIVFFLFGYRSKKSWLIWVIVNLITQGALNIWLNGIATPLNNYLIFSLVLGEIAVFVVEMAAFLILIKERRVITSLYVIVANVLSLFAGGYLITALPF